jgi:hypothetical protein
MPSPPTHLISEDAEAVKVVRTWRKEVKEIYEEYRSMFEETGLLKEFVGVLDRINSTLAVAERYQPPPVIVRTLIYEAMVTLYLSERSLMLKPAI